MPPHYEAYQSETALIYPACKLSFFFRLFNAEVDKSASLSTRLGFGIGVFQGLSNLALNGKLKWIFNLPINII